MIRQALHRLAARPAVYDLIQRAVGYAEVARRVSVHLDSEPGTVLDVGAGTGSLLHVVRRSEGYIWLDNDPEKLRRFLAHARPGAHAVLGDATCLGLGDRVVDWAICVNVSHHLGDDGFASMLHELARVAATRVMFVDAVARSDSWRSRALWSLDRGASPRAEEVLLASLGRALRLEVVERFSVYHTYLLAVGRSLSGRR